MIYEETKKTNLWALLVLWCGNTVLYGTYTAILLGLYLWLSDSFDFGFWACVLVLGVVRAFFALPDCMKRYNQM